MGNTQGTALIDHLLGIAMGTRDRASDLTRALEESESTYSGTSAWAAEMTRIALDYLRPRVPDAENPSNELQVLMHAFVAFSDSFLPSGEEFLRALDSLNDIIRKIVSSQMTRSLRGASLRITGDALIAEYEKRSGQSLSRTYYTVTEAVFAVAVALIVCLNEDEASVEKGPELVRDLRKGKYSRFANQVRKEMARRNLFDLT